MIHQFSIIICVIVMIGSTYGHGRLIQPPSRASAWRFGFNTPIDYNDMEGFCGGFGYQFKIADGKCGICGDPWFAEPREHEAPNGKFATGTITAEYSQGQTIDVQIDITANHKGFFEFRLCPNIESNADPSQDCFDRYLLESENGSVEWNLPDELNRVYDISLKLPENVTCSHCILQWTYIAGNNWGADENGIECVGCGPQEHFRACADISIS